MYVIEFVNKLSVFLLLFKLSIHCICFISSYWVMFFTSRVKSRQVFLSDSIQVHVIYRSPSHNRTLNELMSCGLHRLLMQTQIIRINIHGRVDPVKHSEFLRNSFIISFSISFVRTIGGLVTTILLFIGLIDH